MAFHPHDVHEIEYIAQAMKKAAEAMERLAANMKAKKLTPIYLQLQVAKTYADALYRLAGEADFQFTNQLHAKETGSAPAYLSRQRKNALDKSKREAKASRVAQEIEPTRSARPPKKKPKQ